MMNRREFLAIASGMTLAGATLARAQTGSTPMERTVQTPTLDIGYVESGSATGFPIVLLHGFPDDVHAYDEVAVPLAAAGHRVLVPYLRGYGPTRFRDAKTPRMAEQAAIAQDLIDFADALTLPRFAVAGYDWGGRAANVTMALHPDRVRAAVIVGGYTIQDVFSTPRPSAPQVEAGVLVSVVLSTPSAKRVGLAENRRTLCKLLWQQWSPTWKFTDATYEKTAASFDNPDFVDCVIHSYRHRNLGAQGDPRFDAVEHRLASRPKIDAPTILLYGADDGLAKPSANGTVDSAVYTKLVDRRIVTGAGHFLPHEKPEAVSSALLELLSK